MNCNDIARMLDEREVDRLSAGERAHADAHLATCRDCARDWQIHVRLLNAAIPEVPAGLRARYPVQVARTVGSIAQKHNRFIVVCTLVAMAAAAGILALQAHTPRLPVVATPLPAIADRAPANPPGRMFSSALPSASNQKSSDEARTWADWAERTADWLVARDDPDALIAAALLLSADDSRRIPSLRRAAILAPESARIQAMAMRICAISQPCDTARYEMALRKIAPDNALGWITEVVRSSRMDDKDALARALTSMSHARTYDTYDSSSSLSMISQIRSARVPPPVTSEYFPSKSAYMALDSVATIGTTDYRVLYKVCKSAPDEKTLLECRRIGAAMQAGDSIDHNLAGLTIGGYGLPPNSDEARALAREVVRIKWIIHQLGQLPGMPLDESGAASDQLMEELQGVMAAHPREIDAERALLQEHGLPTEPPADWQPSN